jgi:hypothetical protein
MQICRFADLQICGLRACRYACTSLSFRPCPCQQSFQLKFWRPAYQISPGAHLFQGSRSKARIRNLASQLRIDSIKSQRREEGDGESITRHGLLGDIGLGIHTMSELLLIIKLSAGLLRTCIKPARTAGVFIHYFYMLFQYLRLIPCLIS